jgi:hypothetical protein
VVSWERLQCQSVQLSAHPSVTYRPLSWSEVFAKSTMTKTKTLLLKIKQQCGLTLDQMCTLRIIPEEVAEASQILFRDAHVLPKLFSYELYCRRDRW